MSFDKTVIRMANTILHNQSQELLKQYGNYVKNTDAKIKGMQNEICELKKDANQNRKP